MKLKQRPATNLMALISLMLLLSSNVYAQKFMGGGCSMQAHPPMNFYINYQHQTTGMFGVLANEFPPVTVDGCKSAVGQQLAFGLALRKPSLASDVGDVSFDGVLKPDLCEIKNAPITISSFDEKKKLFDEQFKLLRSCMKIEVSHLDQKQIEFNPKQKFCKIERISPTKLEARGDICFLPIKPDMRVSLSLIIDKNCAKAQYLKDNHIQMSDLEAVLNAYVVPDDSGTYINNQIGSQKVRLAMLPDDNIMPLYKGVIDEGPRFPVEYAPDIYMGQIKIKDDSRGDEQKTFIDMQVFVDNKSQRKCVNGLCAGAGDYQVPLAAEVELFEISNGKRKHIDAWYTGNIYDPFVKAQWQGIYSFGKKVIENYKMEKGKQYEIQLNFYNPYDDFILLTSNYEQLLLDLTLINGVAGLDTIRPISEISAMKLMPTISSLPALSPEMDINKEFEKIRQFFRGFGSETQFPPIYESVCNSDKSKCQKANQKSYFLKLSSRFTLGEVNEEDLSFKMENINVKKDSPVLQSFEKSSEGLPELSCVL
ncbi:MAG: hypothetical protein V4596_02820 [Bdellovibrionota bacterium]